MEKNKNNLRHVHKKSSEILGVFMSPTCQTTLIFVSSWVVEASKAI